MKIYTITQFNKDFPNDEVCLEYVFNQKYGKDYPCPKCSGKGFYKVKGRKCYACAWCGYQLHPLAKSVIHKSPTSLRDWFYVTYMVSVAKNGVSAKEVQRHLGVTYKTAWRMTHQIRELMKQNSTDEKLGGTIEMDETYFGGKKRARGKHKGVQGKIPVFGMVERGGKVKTKKIEAVDKYTIYKKLRDNARKDASIVTDDHRSYSDIKKWGYKHGIINHTKEKFARGDVYTNTIEGFWSQLKRSIHGTYHSVSEKHLQSYLDEFSFRYNRRFSSSSVFHDLLVRLYSR